jgi:rubrerythrin
MDELTKYIFDWCPKLLTIEERKARNHLISLQKIEKAESEGIKNAIERNWLSTDGNVLKLLENGEEKFYKKVIERVLRDNPNRDFLNLCPKCNALARTPEAKQCPKCFYSWHSL